MSDFEKQLNKSMSGAKLSTAEKRELRARVVSYMKYHPRRETVAAEKAQAYLESQPYSVLSFDNVYIRSILGAFAILLFVFVPTIAERAVPGDVLYPVKVRINEEIRSTLTFSASEKIAWETERLERRISEVRLLASEGKLTDEVEAAAVVAVKAHAEAAQDGINKLKDTDADEASLVEVEFESALAVQSAVLDSDQVVEGVAASEGSEGLAVVVREAQATVEATKSTTTPSYEKLSARLELQTTRAYELFASLIETNIVSPEEQSEIERRLDDVERSVAANTVEVTVDSEGNTVTPETSEEQLEGLLMALADTKKLISFMTDIDVRGSVELEELVPVVLTEDERETSVEDAVREAEASLAEAEVVMSDPELVWEEGVKEKTQLNIDNLSDHLVFSVGTTSEEGVSTTTELSLEEKEMRTENIIDLTESLRSLIAPLLDSVVIQEEEIVVATTTSDVDIDDPDVVIDETEQGTTTDSVSEEIEDTETEEDSIEETSEENTDEPDTEEESDQTTIEIQ